MAVDDIRVLDWNKFLKTNITEYLDRNKKQNCTSFKEFLQDNKKVLQFKYGRNLNSDYS